MPQPTSGKTATGSRARHRPDDPQRGVDEHEDGKVVAEVPLALEAVERLGAKLVLGRGDDGLLVGHVGRRHATEARRGVHGRRTADGSGADRCLFRSPASRCASASVAIGPAAGRRPALSLRSGPFPPRPGLHRPHVANAPLALALRGYSARYGSGSSANASSARSMRCASGCISQTAKLIPLPATTSSRSGRLASFATDFGLAPRAASGARATAASPRRPPHR